MRRRDPAPQGLVGAGERPAVGVHLSMAVKGKTGTPAGRGRFYFTTQTTMSREFQSGSGKSYSSPSRSLHPGFKAWNDEALALPETIGSKGAGRVGVVRGNLLWADMARSARWSRVAQKPPAGEKGAGAPPSRRPWCEGNGITARRFSGVEAGEEVFRLMACPNQDCPIAMAGLCKPSAHLLFRLRWNPADPFESQFDNLICEWTTGGWESLAGLRGLFELVLGTAALRTSEEVAMADDEERASWSPGLAAQFGIAQPSLLGLPFVMVVTERTRPAKDGRPASRYPVVSFSFDGDPAEWLLLQRRQLEALTGAPPQRALPPSVQDPVFEAVHRHDSRVELLPDYVEAGELVTLPAQVVAELRALAGELGVSWDALEEQLGGPLVDLPGPSVGFLRGRVEDVIEALRA